MPQTGTPDGLLLHAEGLTVTARGGARVLDDLELNLARGATLGLVGESGAGKSMLGRVIARQLPPGFAVTAGTLRFGELDWLRMSAARHQAMLGRRVAFIPQEPMTALDPVRTVGQQLREHLGRLGVPAAERNERAEDLLAEVRLANPREVMKSYAFQLSGGMCQRVMIALAFAGDPELVVSDEATTALDVSTQAHIVTLIRRLQARRGTGVLFVTHDLGLATRVCDTVAVMYAGTICEAGPAPAVFGVPRHPYTRALLRANPRQAVPGARLYSLPGTMPGVEQYPALAGCRFAPRCAQAQPSCTDAAPPRQAAGAQAWRCVTSALAAPAAAAPQVTPGAPGPLGREPFLVVSGLGKDYARRGGWLRAGGRKRVLQGVDLSIAPGEFIGVVGESGSGKSTLARLLMGLEAPSEGSVSLNGQPLGATESEWHRRIHSVQMIFQDPRSALNPRRATRSLLTQAMEARPHLRAEREQRARQLVGDVGLPEGMLARHPAQMSGGQRQRVNIGRALCDVPQLLIADEIVSGLDVSVQAQVLNLLLDLRQRHKVAVLMISHDLSVVAHLCSRVLVLYRGEVVEQGATADVFARPAHPYTRHLLSAVPPTDPSIPWPR
ncbi:dipeptide ABC transporter ATP-binding protein [Verticiella sediminum]|uniref:Dipeptide ABC transporter ATP-binding protein n=2 Tax=Verticiella sediminum TaxID=1247510 RepID=A0A556AW71_9BURK|nr:dipeptide ABC transporter ATP-binding protein [Verticiella sediminum]